MFFATSLSGSIIEGFARHLALGALGGILQIVRHEAAIDQDEAAIVQGKRRVDIEAGFAFPGRVEMPFALMQESAGDGDRCVVNVPGGGEFFLNLGQRTWR
jgi:hypothetical protein